MFQNGDTSWGGCKQEVNLVEELVRRGLTYSEAACFLDASPRLVFSVWSGPNVMGAHCGGACTEEPRWYNLRVGSSLESVVGPPTSVQHAGLQIA